jgi:hypothetical protein
MFMKKLILAGIIVVVSILAIVFMRDRLGMGMFSRDQQENDLVVVNDSSDTISTEYKDGGQDSDQILKPGDQVTGGEGFIRVFTANKAGSYELDYTFPRPADAPQQVTLSQIVESAKKEDSGDEVIIKKGMIGDISVEYEEARELDSTY